MRYAVVLGPRGSPTARLVLAKSEIGRWGDSSMLFDDFDLDSFDAVSAVPLHKAPSTSSPGPGSKSAKKADRAAARRAAKRMPQPDESDESPQGSGG